MTNLKLSPNTSLKDDFVIDGRYIGENYPTYFIADIAANHDGDLERAKDLIYLAKEAGADAAKFQHFRAETIISDFGFKHLGSALSHQKKWKKSVIDIYRDASINTEWTQTLVDTCKKANITFFTSPYDITLVDYVDQFIPAYKIGSGDITWIELIEHVASKQKPYILATGASTLDDVVRSVGAAIKINPKLALLQCNTNYTGSFENFRYIHLNVLKTYKSMFPNILIGLSDHTPGNVTVLGAVALGAKLIEKHFTDNVKKDGPDHSFSMDPKNWREMVDRTRELEIALGAGVKKIEDNESDTVILQRRSICVNRNLPSGHKLCMEDIIMLRPAPKESYKPYEVAKILGRKLRKEKIKGEYLKENDFED